MSLISATLLSQQSAKNGKQQEFAVTFRAWAKQSSAVVVRQTLSNFKRYLVNLINAVETSLFGTVVPNLFFVAPFAQYGTFHPSGI